MTITITEALAEIKTIGKRITAKREFIRGLLTRQDGLKDPLEKDGGSHRAIEAERQSMRDLAQRIVDLRAGIRKANDDTLVTIHGMSRSIADWLVWRREVAPIEQQQLTQWRATINDMREKAKRAGAAIVGPSGTAERPTDLIVNVSEADLAREIEILEDTLGQLDGVLSLKNATVTIAI